MKTTPEQRAAILGSILRAVPDLLDDLDIGGTNARLLAAESARVGELTAKLDRVRDLADWHETKAMKARRFPGEGSEALMEKAAQVHDDAARRIREALDADGDE